VKNEKQFKIAPILKGKKEVIVSKKQLFIDNANKSTKNKKFFVQS